MKKNIKYKCKSKKVTLMDFFIIPFEISAVYSSIYIIQMLLTSLIPLVTIKVMSEFIDIVLCVKQLSLSDISNHLIILFILISQKYLLVVIRLCVSCKMKLQFSERIEEDILTKKSHLKYKYIESDEELNLMNRISNQPEEKVFEGFNEFLTLVSILIRFLGIFYFLSTTSWWSNIVIIMCIVPIIFMAFYSGKENYNNIVNNSQLKRNYEYLDKVLYSKEFVNERNLFHYTNEINTRWLEKYNQYITSELSILRKWYIRMKTTGILIFVVAGIIIASILPAVVIYKMSTGLFMSLVNAILSIVQSITWDFANAIDVLIKNKEFLKELHKFFAFGEEEKVLDRKCNNKTFYSIEFRNVWFKYPMGENYILKNLNFKLEANKSYAFVGTNGCGKTTIVKLLLGLYDDYKGDILINDISIRVYDKQYLREFFAVIFQDFARYQLSFIDNILIGNKVVTKDNKRVQEVIGKAGLENVLKKVGNYDIKLGKIYENGIDLSGGEWQKIALARNLISDAPIRIFDEPTASLDPISENKLYMDYKKLCSDCTSILITHRLGSTKLVDEIFVIEDGQVIEKGTHEMLYNMQKEYYNMYNMQSEWYNEKK